jgi:ornithine carbamoyltransferase
MSIPSLQHFLDIQSLDAGQFWGLLGLAKELKDERRRMGRNAPILDGRSLALLFQKPSLRTRVSFEMGMQHLGGHAFYISPQEVGLGARESVPDVARVLSGYTDGIMARVFAHDHILELAEWATVPVINGLSDYSHPCQALADLFTIWEYFDQLAGLTLVYVGDGRNNVATSLLVAAGKVEMSIRIVAPEGYLPEPQLVAASGADALVTSELVAVTGADVLYTDVWTSMGQEDERETRLTVFPPYQLNSRLLEMTRNRDVKVMHCLPAHRGEEITDAVADGPNSLIFRQAHNRLHAQKALLAHLLGGVPLQ